MSNIWNVDYKLCTNELIKVISLLKLSIWNILLNIGFDVSKSKKIAWIIFCCLCVWVFYGIFMKFFLNHVRDGAKAMDVCVQDPPKSDVDLEGAWCVWTLGGSASPRKGEGC